MAKQTYAQRIEKRLAEGFSLSQARGHPKKGEQTITQRRKEVKRRKEIVQRGRTQPKPPRQKLPTSYHIDGWQSQGKNKPKRHRVIDIKLTPDQAKEVVRLEKLGKPKTAKTFVLAEVYDAPILAGIEAYQPGMDYDTGGYFDGYDYDDFDWYDVPDEEDDYAIE